MSEEKPTRQPPRKSQPNSPSASSETAPKPAAAQPSDPARYPAYKTPTLNGKEGRYTVTPEFWENLADAVPPWFDEISAIVLLVFGVISLMAVFGISSDATLAMAWSGALTQLFGDGSIIVSLGIFLLGVVILLPKVGIIIRFSARRVLALEIAFLATLGLLHLMTGDVELRAVARAGEGGGYIGWGVSAPLEWLLGSTVATALCGLMIAAGIALALGMRRSHIQHALQNSSAWLEDMGLKWLNLPNGKNGTPGNTASPAESLLSFTLDDSLRRRFSVMRIRPDLDHFPPSQRSNLITLATPTITYIPESLTDEESQRLERALQTPSETQHDKLRRRTMEETIGRILPPDKRQRRRSNLSEGHQMVERPDGRIKRYFTVESMKEARRAIKRGKQLPSIELLVDRELIPPDEHEINHNVLLIENTLLEFDIHIDVVDVKVGPTVTQYAVRPFREVTQGDGSIEYERTRLNKIAALASDLSLSLSAKRLRMETPVPGQTYMGIEVPNKNPSVVALRSVYESKAFYDATQKNKSPLLIPLGRDVAGVPVIVDIATMPHLLIAGTTGSGKSVCIAAMAMAIILNNMPDDVKLVMLDPKMVELSRFNGLPHLLGPVETDMDRITGVLNWCTREMDRRYKILEENSARNLEIYNSRLGQHKKDEHLPYIVIFVDEIGDLMMLRPEETEKTITRLAQMARAVGMHLVVATQRPSVDVITGLIKANFPVRISFAVAAGVDSRVILDTIGAETLLGKGDMLYLAQDASGPRRLQGCYVSDDEVREVVNYWRKWRIDQIAKKKIDDSFAPWEPSLVWSEFLSETDPMLEDAIRLVVYEQEASASQIQRKLNLGYPRAARMIDMLEELGVIGESVAGGRSREILIRQDENPFRVIVERHKKGKTPG